MDPLTFLIVGAVYTVRAIDAEIRANKAKKESSSYRFPSSSSSSSSVSQHELKKKKENRMCQPEIKIDNNKIKSN